MRTTRATRARGKRRLRTRRGVERRLPSRDARLLHRRAQGLLPGFRRARSRSRGRCATATFFRASLFAFWNAPRGTSAKDVPLPANVICTQNHDQVGNRAKGERLTSAGAAGRAQAGGRAIAAGAAYAIAVHGTGVRRDRAVPVLRRLPGSGAEEGRQRRPPQRVQRFRF